MKTARFVLVAGDYVLCSGFTDKPHPMPFSKILPWPFPAKAMVFDSSAHAAEFQRNMEGYNYYDLMEWKGPWWKGRRRKVKIPRRSQIFRN